MRGLSHGVDPRAEASRILSYLSLLSDPFILRGRVILTNVTENYRDFPAFYKHPMELVANSILSGAISYTLLGLSVEAAAWVTVVSALSEFFYHMNIATPRWVGWFIQRPEMHRIHHERGVHQGNYGDLPVWDWCFGTYRNPPRYDGACGFDGRRELRLTALLLARDVNAGEPR